MARILGVGKHVPPNVVTNADLSAFMDTSDEWIVQRTGIKERHWIRRGFEEFEQAGNAALAIEATRRALKNAAVSAPQIDMVVYSTITPDFSLPGSGPLLTQALFGSIPFFEIRNHCAGFLYGMCVANTYIETGTYKNVLVIGGEIQSNGLDLSTRGRNTAVLFGDGCGAIVMGPAQGESKILSIKLESDGSFHDKLGVVAPCFARPEPITVNDYEGEAPDAFPRMDGKLVFKMASEKMPEIIGKVLKESGLDISQVALIVPHQANQRIIDMVGHALGCPEKVYSCICKYGNTTAGSIPIALSDAFDEGRIKAGDIICLVSFGAGFNWGAVLIRW